jgi:hypothetical protein
MYFGTQMILAIAAFINGSMLVGVLWNLFIHSRFSEWQFMLILLYAIPTVLCLVSFQINKTATRKRRMTRIISDVSKMAKTIKDERENDTV